MKISKTAAASARRLFGLCQTTGVSTKQNCATSIARLVESQPRDYQAILGALHRLTRLDLAPP